MPDDRATVLPGSKKWWGPDILPAVTFTHSPLSFSTKPAFVHAVSCRYRAYRRIAPSSSGWSYCVDGVGK